MSAFRKDIEGLRGIAVLLVLFFHAGVPWLSGGYVGVDVFFVISGFLITGLIVKEIESTGSLSFKNFYLRRMRRLLPASFLAIVGIGILSLALLPSSRWGSIGQKTVGAALYVVNWMFASGTNDYFNADSAPNPLQHFWSLAVEEQFYFIWPALVLALAYIAKKTGAPQRPVYSIGLLAIGVPSLWWSIAMTEPGAGAAYFVTTTRLWELVVGAGLAVWAPVVTKHASSLLSLIGLVAVGVAAVTFDSTTQFPGYAAALPVSGAALMLVGGMAPTRDPMSALVIDNKALRAFGAISYSLYLWHWPAVVVADRYWGPLSAWEGLGAIALSILPAWLSYAFVEQRFRHMDQLVTQPLRGSIVGGALTGGSFAIGVGLYVLYPSLPAGPPVADGTEIPTINSMAGTGRGDIQLRVTEPVQNLRKVPFDQPTGYEEGCFIKATGAEPLRCEYTNDNATLDIAVVGSSHAAHWVPAIREIEKEQPFNVTTFVKNSCMYADVAVQQEHVKGVFNECIEWNERVEQQLLDMQPDLVVVSDVENLLVVDKDSGRALDNDKQSTALVDGFASRWKTLTDNNIDVLVVRDIPTSDRDVARCVLENPNDLERCVLDRSESLDENTQLLQAAAQLDLPVIDLIDHMCNQTVCPPVIQNVVTRYDDGHITATFARGLAPDFQRQWSSAYPEMFDTN